MSCPDRFALFVALEEGSATIREHLDSCPRCAQLAEEQSMIGDSLGRLRDPAPPADLLQGVWKRVDEVVEVQARLRRQVTTAVAISLAVAGGLLAAFWRGLVVDAAIETLVAASQLKTAALSLGRAFGGQLGVLALPVVAAQALTLILFALVFHRLVAGSRVRS